MSAACTMNIVTFIRKFRENFVNFHAIINIEETKKRTIEFFFDMFRFDKIYEVLPTNTILSLIEFHISLANTIWNFIINHEISIATAAITLVNYMNNYAQGFWEFADETTIDYFVGCIIMI